MGVRTYKAEVREMLAQRNIEGLTIWAGSVRSPQRVLYSLTHDSDELIAWRAIEAVGKLAGNQADIDRVRDSLRRLLWSMNDESGGLGWRSPELIGEILVNVPSLIDEYGQLLPPFLREEPFERGTHLAISRIAIVKPDPFVDTINELGKSLNDPDKYIRCYAVRAIRAIGPKSHYSAVRKLSDDSAPIRLYNFQSGLLEETTVGQAVMDEINQSGSPGQAA